MIDWRPVETAPKVEREPVLLYAQHKFTVAFWYCDQWSHDCIEEEWTHWAPLTPPEEK